MGDQRTDREGGLIKPERVVLILAVVVLYKLVTEIIKRRYWGAASSVGCLGFVIYYFWNHFKKNNSHTLTNPPSWRAFYCAVG